MERFTLTQIARALRVPQHRLIHLCEEQVVVPDFDDARGRGSSRGFSSRNVFEFATALELRRLQLPVSVVRAVLQSVRSFEATTRIRIPGFALPEGLIRDKAPEVSMLIVDGTGLYFTVGNDLDRRVVGGLQLARYRPGRSKLSPPPRKLSAKDADHVIDSAKTRIEVDLTGIARTLPAIT